MSRGTDRKHLRALLMAGVAAAMCWTAPAVAQERQRYAIPSGDAVAAVQRLAVQSGVQVMVPQSDLKGITTNDINGSYTPVEALRHMLARSEERRVGKECVSACRSRWWPVNLKKNK